MNVNNKNTISDKVAYHCVLSDAYKKKYKIRYKLFRSVLQHMEQCLKEDTTIWILMQEMRNNR